MKTNDRAYLTHNEDEGICTKGTYKQGTLTDITHNQLYLAFGRHIWVEAPDSVDWEWVIEFPCGTVATVYNWNDGPNSCGAAGMNRFQVTTWNVGGNSAEAYHLVKAAIEAA